MSMAFLRFAPIATVVYMNDKIQSVSLDFCDSLAPAASYNEGMDELKQNELSEMFDQWLKDHGSNAGMLELFPGE